MAHNSFHKVIFKNTGLFGVAQFIKLLGSVVTNKVAAVFLGTAGVGVIGLFKNILDLIVSVSNFGIAESSVREIALADQEISSQKSGRLIKIVYKWALATGLLGACIALIFSKQIRALVFNNTVDTFWVVLLGIYFVFTTLTSMRLAVLKAKKQVVIIVKYNIYLAIITAFTASLSYYFLGISGIIPSVVIIAISGFFISYYLTSNIPITKQFISIKEAYYEGVPMAKIGLMLSASVIFGQLCFYGIRWYLKTYHTIEIVGLYQVGTNILVGYIGLVFVAMSNDYYPRLCNYENDSKKFNTLVNDQTELALLLVVPAVLILYTIAPFLVSLLYTNEFINVLDLLKIGLLSIVFKAIVWPIGFIPLIKGNKLLFLKQNVLGDGLNIVFSILLFKIMGLAGLGLAMVIMFVVSGIYNYYVAQKYYEFRFRKETLKLMCFSILICTIPVAIFFVTEFENFNGYITVIAIAALLNSLYQLKTKIKS